MTKMSEIRAKTPDELKDQLIALKKEQFNMRFQRAAGNLEATGRVKAVRRDIARIQTAMGGGDTKPTAVKPEPKVKAPAKKAIKAESAAEPKPTKAKAPKKAAAKKEETE